MNNNEKIPKTRGENNDVDLTGRSRLVSNVIYSWGGYLVIFVAGFIMPRLIDNHIGQTSLGIWDFSWSLVNYLSLSGLGVGSSVNRYVAKYRAAGDIKSLQVSISSVLFIQFIIAFFVFMATALLVWVLPFFFSDRLGAETTSARWVVGLLGSGLAVQMAFDPFRGVITGCHRWDLHNSINAGSRGLTVVGMIIALLTGKGLIGLGFVYVTILVLTEFFRYKTARKVCPELKVSLHFAQKSQAKKMFKFGIKTIIASLPPLILVQTSNLIIVGSLGPAALAVFSRPIALVRHIETFINRFAFILTPTAGSLLGKEQNQELRQFLITNTKYSIAFTLPLLLFLIIFGDQVLTLWMGKDYANTSLITILAVGYFLPISQSSILRILMGMNQHGRVALISLAASIISYCFCLVFIFTSHPKIETAGLLVAIPLTLSNGIILPLYGCRIFNINLVEYISKILITPLLCCTIYGISLVIIKFTLNNEIIYSLSSGLIIGGLILVILYWFYLFPHDLRLSFINRLKKIHS